MNCEYYLITAYFCISPGIAIRPEIISWHRSNTELARYRRIIEPADSYNGRPTCHGAGIMVATFFLVKRVSFYAIKTVPYIGYRMQGIAWHPFIYHPGSCGVFKAGPGFKCIGKRHNGAFGWIRISRKD